MPVVEISDDEMTPQAMAKETVYGASSEKTGYSSSMSWWKYSPVEEGEFSLENSSSCVLRVAVCGWGKFWHCCGRCRVHICGCARARKNAGIWSDKVWQ